MILRNRPGPFELLFALRGSVLTRIAPELLVILVISALILLWDARVGQLTHLSGTPFALFGVALSLFPGFRNNAAYDRWREAREAGLFLPDAGARHHLRRCQRRDIPTATDTEARTHATAAGLTELTSAAALDGMAAILATSLPATNATGRPDGFGAMVLSNRLAAYTQGMTACERIQNTPLPYACSMLVYRTTWIYCLLLPLALIEGAGWMAAVHRHRRLQLSGPGRGQRRAGPSFFPHRPRPAAGCAVPRGRDQPGAPPGPARAAAAAAGQLPPGLSRVRSGRAP